MGTWQEGLRSSGSTGLLDGGDARSCQSMVQAALVPLLMPFLPFPSRMIQGRSVSQCLSRCSPGLTVFKNSCPNSFLCGNGTPLQSSCLENPMDGGAWWAAVHGVARSWTRLSDFTFTSHFHALEKEMATHSSILAWRIPGTEEPGGLLSVELHRVRHD